MSKISTVCLSSTLQRTITFKQLTIEHVNRSEKYRMDASGKAVNSARVLNQLESGCADVICPLGKENADRFMELAKRDGLNIQTVLIPGYTRECWTLLDRTNHGTTELVVSEPVVECDVSSQTEEIVSLVTQSLKTSEALLLAGSRPGIWPKDLYARLVKCAIDAGRVVMADYWGEDLNRTLQTAIPHIIKINEEEFCGTFGYTFPLSVEDLKAHIVAESTKYNTVIVVTRGKDETFAAKDGVCYAEPVEKIQVVNSTACGDSFSAGFLYEYLHSVDMQRALKKGTWCAARNAELECPGAVQSDE